MRSHYVFSNYSAVDDIQSRHLQTFIPADHLERNSFVYSTSCHPAAVSFKQLIPFEMSFQPLTPTLLANTPPLSSSTRPIDSYDSSQITIYDNFSSYDIQMEQAYP